MSDHSTHDSELGFPAKRRVADAKGSLSTAGSTPASFVIVDDQIAKDRPRLRQLIPGFGLLRKARNACDQLLQKLCGLFLPDTGSDTTIETGRDLKARSAPRPAPSVFRLLVIGFVLITIIPTAILAWEIYRGAWDNAWREITEKHQLLATNLSSPISIYVNDHRDMLGHLSGQIGPTYVAGGRKSRQRVLDSALTTLQGFKSLAVVDHKGSTDTLTMRDSFDLDTNRLFANETYFQRALTSGQMSVSSLKRSPVTGEPTIFIASPVFAGGSEVRGVLLGELRLDRLEELRDSVRFGRKGHSAIVDNTGRVLAHGNREWVREMKDLSHLGVVDSMLRRKTGVTEFYSPFLKKQMVAGYTSVPGLGWGVMVPQPREEIEEQVWSLLSRHFLWAGFCSLLALLVAISFARWITNPINQLAAAAKALKQGEFEGRIPRMPTAAPKEVHQLSSSLRELLADLQKSRANVYRLNQKLRKRVDRSTEKLKRANANLADLARSDHLTRLYNRLYFEYAVKNVLEDRDRRGGPHALMVMDLDKFKVVNDTCGHIAGDELLKRIAGLLGDMVRNNDIIARLGGDEFAVLLRNCSEAEARTVANNVRDAFADIRFKWEEHRFDVTASIGLVMVTPGDADLETVLHAADQSCLEAKSQGRDRICVRHLDEHRKSTRVRESRWIFRITDAIENDGFRLYFQPIIPVNNPRRGVHCEVLLRLRDTDNTILNPGAFLPPAERFQLMPQIDRWVTSKVIDFLATEECSKCGVEVFLVNLSAQSLTDDRFAEFVAERLARSGVSGRKLCFEITETAAISSLSRAAELMTTLQALGCRFALDDFGSGMSSFDYLTELPVQVLKIDGSYVEQIATSDAHRAIVRSINDIGHAMNMVTIAESVSDERILHVLREIGVNYAQGYVIGRPEPLIDRPQSPICAPAGLAAGEPLVWTADGKPQVSCIS